LWLFGVALFALFSLLFVLRLALFRETLWPMLLHPVQSMFLGAIPMGLAVLLKGLLLFGVPRWGEAVYALAHALWWLDAALALLGALLVPYLMFTRQNHALEKLTAVWLLPIIAPEVAASTAGSLAPHLAAEQAQQLLVVGFVLWGVSLSLAFSLITLVLLRLALHKLPDTDFAATSWLPLGPLATGCLGLLGMGQAAPAAFVGTPLAGAAERARPRPARRPGAVGRRALVAGDRQPVHPSLHPRQHAVQPRLVGFHLPAGGVHPGHLRAAGADRLGLLRPDRPGADGAVERGLVAGVEPHPGRRLARRTVPGALSEWSGQPGGERVERAGGLIRRDLRPSVIAPRGPAGRKWPPFSPLHQEAAPRRRFERCPAVVSEPMPSVP
jgi:hypothetical protein